MGPGGSCNVVVPWGHRFPTSTPSRTADCSGSLGRRSPQKVVNSKGTPPKRPEFRLGNVWELYIVVYPDQQYD